MYQLGTAKGCHQEPEARKEADPLALDFWPSDLCKNTFLLF